jgi:hypothetical protein
MSAGQSRTYRRVRASRHGGWAWDTRQGLKNAVAPFVGTRTPTKNRPARRPGLSTLSAGSNDMRCPEQNFGLIGQACDRLNPYYRARKPGNAMDRFEATAATTYARVLWGATQIGAAIGRTEKQTFHMLIRGMITSAIKKGNLWCANAESLRREFSGESQTSQEIFFRDDEVMRTRTRGKRGSKLLLQRLIEHHGPDDRSDLHIVVDGIQVSTARVSQ